MDLSAKIRDADGAEREAFIASKKEFIRRYASYICKRNLDWSNDDELSIALLAFNEAIDSYDPDSGKNFAGYSRLLMRNRLVDYFRQQSRPGKTRLGMEEGDLNPEAAAGAWQRYLEETERLERFYDIQYFSETLADFNLSLEDLVRFSPRHTDTRNRLKRIALEVAGDEGLVKKVYRQKRLPLQEMELMTRASRKFLEYWRKYLLSLIIVLTREELASLAEYIQGGKEADGEG